MSKEKANLKFESNSFSYAQKIVVKNLHSNEDKTHDFRNAADRATIGYKQADKASPSKKK